MELVRLVAHSLLTVHVFYNCYSVLETHRQHYGTFRMGRKVRERHSSGRRPQSFSSAPKISRYGIQQTEDCCSTSRSEEADQTFQALYRLLKRCCQQGADERKCKIERNAVNTPDRLHPQFGGILSIIDTHTPRDSILKKIPNTISRDKFNKCDKDLLELHFFQFSVYKQARQGHLWISDVQWNSLDATDLVDKVEFDPHSRKPLSKASFAFFKASNSDEYAYEDEQARRIAQHKPALAFIEFFGKDILWKQQWRGKAVNFHSLSGRSGMEDMRGNGGRSGGAREMTAFLNYSEIDS